MEKRSFLLRDERIRENLKAFIDSLPTDEHRPLEITINGSKRNLSQNNLFHALCTDVSRQVLWADKPRPLLDWKAQFVSGHAIATGRPGEVVTGLEGEFCSIRESTAQIGVRRMSSLIAYVQAWAVGNGVRLREVRYSGDYFGRVG
ncbi:MAG: recombination protein NinB [Sodalis sp. (in: enterobacteria)]|uniref:recombination protein NinB n=1 Tax=Sodalis sp. (in: enterobacteria) TaxID=1898979 RepID=UPI0039E29265